MLKIGSLAAALCVVACAAAPAWTKQGVSPQQAAQDYSDCRSQAQAMFMRDVNIQTDILASRGRDWQQTGTLSAHDTIFGNENRQQQSDYVKSCMISKGYAPGR